MASIVGLAIQPGSGNLVVYGEFGGSTLYVLDQNGTELSTLPSPGVSSNDYDLDYTTNETIIGGVPVAPGSLLVFNGDDSPENLYALDAAGTVVANVALASASLVGGTHVPGTNTVATIDFQGNRFYSHSGTPTLV